MVKPTLQLVILDTLWRAQLQWVAMMGPFQLLQLAQVICSTTISSNSHSCLDCVTGSFTSITLFLSSPEFHHNIYHIYKNTNSNLPICRLCYCSTLLFRSLILCYIIIIIYIILLLYLYILLLYIIMNCLSFQMGFKSFTTQKNC